MTTGTSHRSPAEVRRVALSSYLGTTIEYYDFLLYGTAAALVFNSVFFSNLSPVVGTIVSLSTLAAGYAARFVGAIVFGHFGDRLGRKNVMLVTMIAISEQGLPWLPLQNSGRPRSTKALPLQQCTRQPDE